MTRRPVALALSLAGVMNRADRQYFVRQANAVLTEAFCLVKCDLRGHGACAHQPTDVRRQRHRLRAAAACVACVRTKQDQGSANGS
jgi:hypothetical protein